MDDERLEELRRRMYVRVVHENGDGEDEVIEVPPGQFAAGLRAKCADMAEDVLPDDIMCEQYPDDPASTCEQNLCEMHIELCVAHRLLDIAGAVSPVEVERGVLNCPDDSAVAGCLINLVEGRVPPQSTETNAGLAKQAIFASRRALFAADGGLDELAHDDNCDDRIDAEVGEQGATVPESFATGFTEAYWLLFEGSDGAEKNYLAAADGFLSEEPSLDRAAAAAQVGPELSRATFAHIMVGGSPGINNSTKRAICASPDPSPGVELATDALREAAPPPGDLFTMDIDQLVAGDQDSGSIAARLRDKWDVDSIGGAAGDLGLDGTADDVYGALNVSRGDFLEAQGLLLQDVAAHGRSLDATLPARPRPGGEPTTFQHYAATASSPGVTPDGYWSLLASQEFTLSELDDRPPGLDADAVVPVSRDYAGESVLATIDWAPSRVDNLLAGDLPAEARDVLGLFAVGAKRERIGRLETCYKRDDGDDLARIRLLGDFDPAEILIVEGADGLRCATRGHIEGAECEVQDYVLGSLTEHEVTETNRGFAKYLELVVRDDLWERREMVSGQFHFFAVRQKPGATPGMSGSYEELVGGQLALREPSSDDSGDFDLVEPIVDLPPPLPLGWEYCDLNAISPELLRTASNAIARSPDDCTDSAVDCAEIPADIKIPLEDELTDDADRFEDSWRHYLNLAKQASDEADQLGERVIESGLAVDRRAEAALDDLEQLCGVSINVDGLFDPDLSMTSAGSCVDGECSTEGFVCVGEDPGRCIRDPVQLAIESAATDADAARLKECLGDQAVADLVTFGDSPVCAWRIKGDPNSLCDQTFRTVDGLDFEDRTCPQLARVPEDATAEDELDKDTACPDSDVLPVVGSFTTDDGTTIEYETVLVDEGLGFFDTEALGFGPGETPPCDEVRRMRSRVIDPRDRGRDMRSIRKSGYFEPEQLRSIAHRIGWEARPGDYSVVTFDGTPWFSTGDLFTAPPDSPEWPCAPQTGPQNCDEVDESLFCTDIDCSDQAQRADFNYRLAHAVLGARITTGAGLTGLRLPYYPYWQEHSSTIRGEDEPTLDAESVNDPTAAAEPLEEQAVEVGQGLTIFADAPGEGKFPNAAKNLARVDPTARAYCAFSDATIWTNVDDEVPASPPTGDTWPLNEPCFPDSPSLGGIPNGWLARPVFTVVRARDFLPAEADAIGGVLWSGFGPRRGSRRSGFGPLMREVLNAPTRSRIELGPGTDNISSLTFFWTPHDSPSTDEARKDSTLFLGRRGRGGREWNGTRIAHNGLTTSDLLDTTELICEAGRRAAEGCDPSNPVEVHSIDDLPAAKAYLECVANTIERGAALMLVSSVPRRAIEAVKQHAQTGTFPRVGGQFGENVASIAEALVGIASAADLIAFHVRSLGNDLERIRIRFERIGIRRDRADLQLMSTISTQIASCVSATSSAAGLGGALNPGQAIAAGATCANSFAQISIAKELNKLEDEELALDGEEAVADFRQSFEDRTQTFNDLSTQLNESRLQLDASLARLESQRRRGSRQIARAFMLDTDAMGRHYNVNTVLRRRFNTDMERYKESLKAAKKFAVLARIAMEQRLGTKIEDLERDLVLVDKPATWVDNVCDFSGIDYSRIRDSTELPSDNFAGDYIGDYVRRLERVMEGYRIAYPFQNGSDATVISMRDELKSVRTECDTEVDNFLLWSGQLDTRGATGWQLDACPPLDDGLVRNCIDANALPADDPPFTTPDPDFSMPVGYRVQFGADGADDPSSLTDDSALVQQVELPPGRYRLSWYGRPAGDGTLDPREAVLVRPGSPEDPAPTIVGEAQDPVMPMDGEWTRFWVFLDVPAAADGTAQQVEVAITRTDPSIAPQQVDLAAFMLEDVSDLFMVSFDAADLPPKLFVATTDSRLVRLPACEDTTGRKFRASEWRHGCVRVCPEGTGTSCSSDTTTQKCYFETSFTISQQDIDRGDIIRPGGFATGNFNYRIDTLGLNFVGTAARECEDDDLPSTCFSAGFVPYTILHAEPYSVRNHAGDESYEAPLNMGRIERARGLAAERYLTNPLSSADRGLIEPYLRREFRGRPLTGTYKVRVWDIPGVSFQGIEDIQVILNYRYWTRFE